MDTLKWGEILIILIGLIIGIAFGRKSERKLTSGLFVPKHDSAGNDSKGENSLPVRIIKDMGIQYELLDDGRCIFTYQGEHLYIDYASKDPRFFRIVDIRWFGVPADDIDKVCLVQKVINICNAAATCKYVYNIDKEDNCLDVSSMREMFLPSDITEAKEYMRITLDLLLHSHQTFYEHMEETRQEEYATKEFN